MLSFHIDKNSDTTVREQLRAQIELKMAIGELKAGDLLPSAGALGRRLKIHKNTIYQVYGDLFALGFLVRRHGAQMAVRSLDARDSNGAAQDLDDLLNDAILRAAKSGYSLREFRHHVLARFGRELPRRVLLVTAERLFGELLQAELAAELTYPIGYCLMEEFAGDPSLAAGAVIVSHPALMPKLAALTEKGQPLLALQYNDTASCINMVGQLSRPSLIALVSVSEYVLKFAHLVFSPVAGDRHSITDYVAAEGAPLSVGTADVIICDSLIYRGLTARDKSRVVPYRIVSDASIQQIQSLMDQALSKPE